MKRLNIHSSLSTLLLGAMLATCPASLWAQDTTLNESHIARQDSVIIPEDDEDDLMLSEETYIFPTSLSDGWHLTAHAGVFQSWGSYTGETAFLNKTNPAFGISLGKYLSPVNDLRLQLLWGRNTGVYGRDYKNQWGHQLPNWHFQSLSLAAQYLPNLTNLFYGYEENRRFMLSAMAGISLIRTFGYAGNNDEIKASLDSVSVWSESPRAGVARSLVGLEFGLLAEYKLTERTRLSLEVTNTFVDDIYDGRLSGHVWDGHVNVLLGLTWHLYDKKISNARIRNRFAPAKYDHLKEVIRRNRDKAKDLEDNPNVEIEELDVHKKVTYTLVAMNKDQLSVPRLQQANVYTTATLWKTYTEQKHKTMIFVTNNSKQNDQTFRSRAWSICNLLSQRWSVPTDDIRVIADEDMIKDMDLMGYEHYVIVVINETPVIK